MSTTYNTALGYQALRATTTGGGNVAAGGLALYSNTTGQSNVAVGTAALYTNTTAAYNTAVGGNALYGNTTGQGNVATGYQTMASNDTGGNNTASGFYAMNANSGGGSNTATGSTALQYNTTGSFNVANGAGALFYANSITGTVAIGSSAGFGVSGQTTFSNGVFVGIASGGAITTGGNNTFLGAYSGDSVTTGGSNIVIGYNADAPTATSSNTLNIGNAISGTMTAGSPMTFIGGIKANGVVTATYFEGDGSRLTGIAGGGTANLSETIAINDLKDASASTALGSMYLGLGNGGTSVAQYNTALGVGTLTSLTTGPGNVAVGYQVMAVNTTGNYSVGVGYQALNANTTGSANTAIGNAAQQFGTTAINNTAVGSNAMVGNHVGPNNVAMGANALSFGNPVTNTVVIGTNAGMGTYGPTQFANGTFVGYASGQAITTGNDNTFLGAWAGATTTTGTSNTLIGALAYAPTAGTSNWLNIGNAISGSMASGGSLTFIGGIKANGIVTATYFEGDGSRLTGIAGGGGSEITSGTTKVSTNSNGYISLTTGGVTTGYFDTLGNLVTPGIGIGTAPLNWAPMVISNTAGTSFGLVLDGTNNYAGVGFYRSGVQQGSIIQEATGNMYYNSSATTIIRTGGSTERMRITSAGLIGIGGITAPTSTLEVSGTVSATRVVVNGSPLTVDSSLNMGWGTGVVSKITSGIGNIGIGGGSIANTTSGYSNTAMGSLALSLNTTGGYNSAFGSGALYKNVSGNSNIAMGYNSLYNNTSGGNNVAMGYFSLLANTTASNNVGLGMSSGQAITTGGNNTFLGAYAGDSVTTGGSNIIIGYNADAPTATTSNSLNIGNTIYGDLAMGRIGIGVASPSVALQVNGVVSATQFIGDGSLLTGISAGGSEITSGTTKVSTNSNGYISLTTGGVTTGYFNTLGKLIAPGIGIGIAVPTAPLQIYGAANADSYMNIGVGLSSADGLNIGHGGASYGAGVSFLNAHSLSGTSGALRFIVDGVTAMNVANGGAVGIGTTAPLGLLHVSASTSVSAAVVIEANSATGLTSPRLAFIDTISGTVGTQPMWAIDNNRDTFRVFRQPTLTTPGAVAMVINSATQVAIGKTTVGYKLDVNGQVAGAGAYVNTSDARLKKDVTPIAYGLDTVMKLRPVGFNWIDQAEAWKKQHQIGLIAQEVEGVIPEVVSVANDTSRTRSLAYSELVPVLIKAVQDLKGENMELQTQNDQLKGNVKAMQDMLMKQNLRLDALEKRTIH